MVIFQHLIGHDLHTGWAYKSKFDNKVCSMFDLLKVMRFDKCNYLVGSTRGQLIRRLSLGDFDFLNQSFFLLLRVHIIVKEVVRLAWFAWPHASHKTRIKNERHKHYEKRYFPKFCEVSTL